MNSTNQEKDQRRPPEKASQLSTLVDAAKSGDRAAFARLIEMFSNDLYRLAYYRTQSRSDAEDIIQDAFIKAYKNLKGLKKAHKFKSWLFRIGVNRVNDYLRKRKLMSIFRVFNEEGAASLEMTAAGNPDGAMQRLIKHDFWKQFKRVLKKLSPMEKEVFMFRFLDHFSIREISDLLKKNESTIKTHLYRALKKVRGEKALINLLKEQHYGP